MCVAAIAWLAHPRWRLVAIGNRDEFHGRPTAPLAVWDDGILAGRDLEAGGTWLGAHPGGRFALVTNLRAEGYPRPSMASRGALVTNWLLERPLGDLAAMNPFNLLVAGPDGAELLTNHPAPQRQPLTPGIHGLSNGSFADRWFKTLRLEAALAEWLVAGEDDTGPLFAAMADPTPSPDTPDAEFSSVFIANPAYGTRCSSVVLVDGEGRGQIIERSFGADGKVTSDLALEFDWP
jgi:uncharacterized protein with NRDE domain